MFNIFGQGMRNGNCSLSIEYGYGFDLNDGGFVKEQAQAFCSRLDSL